MKVMPQPTADAVRKVMETYPALETLTYPPAAAAGADQRSGLGLAHAFVTRVPGIEVSTDKAATLEQLKPWHAAAREALGFPADKLFTAEQIHGGETARITSASPRWTPGVDGLMTNEPGLLLGIHTADCAPVFLVDPVRRAIALLHSGRKSTEAGITPHTIRLMTEAYGTRPADLIVQIAPCIRPPLFEIDIAAIIRHDAIAAGVPASQVHDCGTCTGSDLDRYYSYRVEKGKTGRLLSLLGIKLPS